MGVNVVKRLYQNRYLNNTGVTSDVDWLIGNVGDVQSLYIDVEFSVDIDFTSSSPLNVSSKGFSLRLVNGDSWADYGFAVGDSIISNATHYEYGTDGTVSAGFPKELIKVNTVKYLQGDTITLNEVWLKPDERNYPYTSATEKYSNIKVYANKAPESAIITYGHISNDNINSDNLASFIDGSLTNIQAKNMKGKAINYNESCTLIGLQSGMSITKAEWTYLSVNSFTYTYRFRIDFIISSFFEDITNFEKLEAPKELFNANALTDNFKIVAYPQHNNPNVRLESDIKQTRLLGNTGWFNENYNGLTNNAKVESLTYTDVANSVIINQLSHGAEVHLKAVISGVGSLGNGLSLFSVGFIWLPEDENIYKNKDTSFHKNLLINTGGGIGTGVFTQTLTPLNLLYTGYTNSEGAGMNFKAISFKNDSSNNLVFEATFTPNSKLEAYIESLGATERHYAIWLSVSDSILGVNNFSNRANLLLDYNELALYVPPIGEFNPMLIGLYEYWQDGTSVADFCSTDYKIEDDLLARIDLNIDITKDIPTAINLIIEAERLADGLKNELSNYTIDLTGYDKDSTNVPQWNYEASRGFKLDANDVKNKITLKRNASKDNVNSKAYVLLYPFRIRWEDWLLKTGLSTDFYNEAKEHNGYNENWLKFIENSGWKLNFTVHTTSTLNGNIVNYINKKPFGFTDYDSNPKISTVWNFYRNTGNVLIASGVNTGSNKASGVILGGEKTRVEVSFIRAEGTWSDLSKVYGIISIEVNKGAGQGELWQLSSLYKGEADNPLQSIDSTNLAKLTLVSPTILKVECLVEPSLLQGAVRYKLSSKLGCRK